MRSHFMRFIALVTMLFGHAALDASESFHIYAPCRSTDQLLVIEARFTNGRLALHLEEQVDLGFSGSTITAHPQKPLLYIAPLRDQDGKTEGSVIHLGKPDEIRRQTPFPLHHGYAYLSLDRDNRFLLGADYFGGFVDVYELDASGMPGRRVTALDEGRLNAHCILPSPDNRFVYIPYVKDKNALYQYRFDGLSGDLTALDPKNASPPEGTGPRHMAYHPKLPIVYFSNEQHLGVSVYEQAKSGQLRIRQVCDAVDPGESKEGLSSSDIVVSSNGKFLFAGIRGHQRDFDWISRYQVKPNGEVELLGLTPADKIPWGLAFSPDGSHLLVTAFQGGTITAYRFGVDGNLTRVASLDCPEQISDLVTR